MIEPEILDLYVPPLHERGVEIYHLDGVGIYDLEEEAVGALEGLQNVITNFRVLPSQHGIGCSVWCDSYSSAHAIDTRDALAIGRDSLLSELVEQGFDVYTGPMIWLPRGAGGSHMPECDIRCARQSSDYELRITLRRGSITVGFWPKGWRTRQAAQWTPVEITRHSDGSTFCNREQLLVIRLISAMAREDRPLEELREAVQVLGSPGSKLTEEGLLLVADESCADAKSADPFGRVAIEIPRALELRSNLPQLNAQDFARSLGVLVTNFRLREEGGGISVVGDVVWRFDDWDRRTDEQKLRDVVIDSLRCRGLIAEIPGGAYEGGFHVFVDFLDPRTRRRWFSISEWEIGCLGEEPDSNLEAWFSFPFEKFPGGAPAAYCLLSVLAEVRLRGEPIGSALRPYLSIAERPRVIADDDDAMVPAEVFGGGGYMSDGLWMTGCGVQDRGR